MGEQSNVACASGPAHQVEVEIGGAVASRPRQYTLRCAVSGATFNLDAKPTRGQGGWAKVWCRACRGQHRHSALCCMTCGRRVPDCEC
eukprot:4141626-Alexandrium_andersonii.AAC.1